LDSFARDVQLVVHERKNAKPKLSAKSGVNNFHEKKKEKKKSAKSFSSGGEVKASKGGSATSRIFAGSGAIDNEW